MNVKDIKEEMGVGDCDNPMELIFLKQEELEKKYAPIEAKQGVGYGLLNGRDFHIDEIRSQELLKNMAWRVTEELTEATAAVEHKDHFEEEVVDALHFLVALALTVGLTAEDVAPGGWDDLFNCPYQKPDAYQIIEQIGLAMNCLKQKPWKQTHILTDREKANGYIIQAFREFACFCVNSNLTPDRVFTVYFKKHKVNNFRIQSGY